MLARALADIGTRPPYTPIAAIAASAAIVALAALVVRGEWLAAIILVAGGIALRARARPIVGMPLDASLGAVLVVAFAARVAVLAVLHWIADGTLGGDDLAYRDLAWHIATQGDAAIRPEEAFLVGPWVRLQSAIFAVAGPHVAIVSALNILAGLATALLVARGALRAWSPPAAVVAAALIGLAPSLVLWSAVGLRESIVVLGVALIVIGADELAHRPLRAGTWLGTGIAALTMFRSADLAAAGLVAAAVAAPLRSRALVGVGLAGVMGLAAVAVLSWSMAGAPSQVEARLSLAERRAYAAVFARTALVAPAPRPFAPVAVRPGDRLLVWDVATDSLESAPLRTLEIRVPVDVRLNGPTAGSDAVAVRHRDLLVIAGGEPSHAEPAYLLIGARSVRAPYVKADYDVRSLALRPDLGERARMEARSIGYLPHGLAAAAAAPYVWTIEGPRDALAVAETLVFAVLLVAAAVTCLRERARWRRVAVPALLLAGVLIALALTEGNAGTLFRHRSMSYPLVAILAAPSIDTLVAGLRSRLRRERGR